MAWHIEYYENDDGSVPGAEFLDGCPGKIDAQFNAVLDAVAAAPPPKFSGGGKWEAMHGTMGGYYEIRLTGPNREQFRLFCVLENATPIELRRRGLKGPSIVVINACARRTAPPLPTATTATTYGHSASTTSPTFPASLPGRAHQPQDPTACRRWPVTVHAPSALSLTSTVATPHLPLPNIFRTNLGEALVRLSVATWSTPCTVIRGNSLTTVTSSDVSNASTEPHNLDHLDAARNIYARRAKLRALWT